MTRLELPTRMGVIWMELTKINEQFMKLLLVLKTITSTHQEFMTQK